MPYYMNPIGYFGFCEMTGRKVRKQVVLLLGKYWKEPQKMKRNSDVLN